MKNRNKTLAEFRNEVQPVFCHSSRKYLFFNPQLIMLIMEEIKKHSYKTVRDRIYQINQQIEKEKGISKVKITKVKFPKND